MARKKFKDPVSGGSWPYRATKNQIVFGCGAVRVRKSDLMVLAEAISALPRLERAWRVHNRDAYIGSLLSMPKSKILNLLK